MRGRRWCVCECGEWAELREVEGEGVSVVELFGGAEMGTEFCFSFFCSPPSFVGFLIR